MSKRRNGAQLKLNRSNIIDLDFERLVLKGWNVEIVQCMQREAVRPFIGMLPQQELNRDIISMVSWPEETPSFIV